MSEFFTAAYFEALFTAIKYGLGVVVTMALVGAVLALVSGGPAAKNWKSSDAH